MVLIQGGVLEKGRKDGSWGWMWSKHTGPVLALAIGKINFQKLKLILDFLFH